MEDNKLKEELEYMIAISKMREESDITMKKNKVNIMIKRGIGFVACFAIIFSGIVYAKDIENYFKKIFNNSTEAIDKAVENGYVQQENMDYTYDKDIGIKVDSLILDDLNLDISFNFETKKENIKSIHFDDFIITNDNDKVVFSRKFISADNPDELPIYNSVNWGNEQIKLNNTTYSDSILFGLRPEKEEFKELYFDVKSIQIIYYDDTKETIEGNWKFNVKISDEMRRKTANIYNISENNEYIENCTVTISNTGTIVELNSKVEIPDITYEIYGVAIMDLIHLKDNEKTYEPCSVEHNENYMKIVFEDVGNFIVNSDALELHLDWFNTIIKLNKNIIE